MDDEVDPDALLAVHDAACDCGMGRAKCAPGTPGIGPAYCYVTDEEMEADGERRYVIAERLAREGRL